MYCCFKFILSRRNIIYRHSYVISRGEIFYSNFLFLKKYHPDKRHVLQFMFTSLEKTTHSSRHHQAHNTVALLDFINRVARNDTTIFFKYSAGCFLLFTLIIAIIARNRAFEGKACQCSLNVNNIKGIREALRIARRRRRRSGPGVIHRGKSSEFDSLTSRNLVVTDLASTSPGTNVTFARSRSSPLSRTIGGVGGGGEKMVKHSLGPDKSSDGGRGRGEYGGVEGRVDAKCRKGGAPFPPSCPALPLSALLSKVTFLPPPPVTPSIIRVTPPLPSCAASIVRSFDFFLVRKWLSSHLRKTSGRLETEMEFPEKGGRPGPTGVAPRVEVSPGYKIAVRERLIINLIKPARCTCNRIG